MSKLLPTNPQDVTVIRQLVPNVVTTVSAPFWRFGRIAIGGRSTIIRLQSGALAVFSPVALTNEVQETVRTMGEVKYIAALDFEHHLYLGPWHKAYPNARVLGPEGLYEKRKKQKNEDVPISVVFTRENKDSVKVDSEFDSEFDYAYVSSHPNKELVFHHKPTRTLIEGDLIFNLPASEQFSKTDKPQPQTASVLTRLFTAVGSTSGAALGQKRFLWYAISRGDRTGYNASIAKIHGWDFDRIVPCHGDVVETDGKGIYEKIMAWHLDASKKTG